MLHSATPESVGLRSEDLADLLSLIEKRKLHMHSLLVMRGDSVVLDAYWAPFKGEDTHRMYSVTKSFVSVAIGLAEEDGLISLDAPIASYFPDKAGENMPVWLREQTVRQMLTMTTVGEVSYWLGRCYDRTADYLQRETVVRPAGTIWEYDSTGSQVLSSLVERVTGKTLFEYLNERIFTRLGAFKNARMLQTPNGDTWGDSSLICTPRDLATFARFVMNYGVWEGERLMNEEYLREATKKQVTNAADAHPDPLALGYGYQFWRTEEDGFAFVGMGTQLALCFPKQDVIVVCTADHQVHPYPRRVLVAHIVDQVVARVKDAPLPENPEAKARLDALASSLSLFAVTGGADSPMREEIDGALYTCDENPLGWKSFRFRFEGADAGVLTYEKASGEMELPFYINRNRFGIFPEEGYSRERGGVRTTDGHRYRDAVSAAWVDETRLVVYVQITDDYFGNATLTFAFRDDLVLLRSVRYAEDFLWDYQGDLVAYKDKR